MPNNFKEDLKLMLGKLTNMMGQMIQLMNQYYQVYIMILIV